MRCKQYEVSSYNFVLTYLLCLLITNNCYKSFYRCVAMPLQLENRCCRTEDLSNTHIPDFNSTTCITETDIMKVILSPEHIQADWMYDQRYLGKRGQSIMFHNMTLKNYRYHAYRCYIFYIYGLLGRYNRKVIPSCVVNFIRQKWPDPMNNYVGFLAAETDDNDELNEVIGDLDGF